MNINYHYAAVKVLSQHAGFSAGDSELVAYASQYVDDANAHQEMGLDKNPRVRGIRYHAGEFDPICTAHKDLDYTKSIFSRGARRLVYVCFHFIPSLKDSSGLAAARQVEKGGRLAEQLVNKALRALSGTSGERRKRELIRLGIALHSYADTWAHQGFSGFWDSKNNDIRDLRKKDASGNFQPVDVVSTFLSYAAPDIGHAEAGTLPDESDVSWGCKPRKMAARRSNCVQFLEAAEKILALLSRATQSRRSWNSIKNKLKKCLMNPVKTAGALKKGTNHAWAEKFPEVEFAYDPDAWFAEALRPKGGFLDVVGARLGLDPLDFEVVGGRKYFYFHAAAKDQRQYLRKVLEARRWLV